MVKFVIALFALVAVSACGTTEAKRLASELEASSQIAIREVALMRDQNLVIAEANEALLGAFRAYVEAVPIDERSSAALAAVLHEHKTKLIESYNAELLNAISAGGAIREDALQDLQAALQPLDDRVEELEKRFEADPTNIRRGRDYFRLAAATSEIRITALEKINSAFAAYHEVHIPELHSTFESHNTDLDERFALVGSISAGIEIDPLNGVEPINPVSGFDELIQYLQAVGSASDAFKLYFEVNGVGKGSIFERAISSIRSGAIDGVSGEQTSVEELEQSWSALTEPLNDQLEQLLAEAGATAEAAVSGSGDAVIRALHGRIATAISDADDESQKILQTGS